MSIKPTTPILLCLIATGFFAKNSQAQSDTLDPFLGNYKLINSSELIFFAKDLNIYDFQFEEDAIKLDTVNTDINIEYPQDGCVGNFLGDYRDEILQISVLTVDSEQKTRLQLIEFTDGALTPIVCDSIIFPNPLHASIVIPGNFDSDYNSEFVIAYWDRENTQKIIIELYDVQDRKIVLLDSISDAVIPVGKYQVYFDLSTASLDKDHMNEFALVHVGEQGTDRGYYIKTFDIQEDKILPLMTDGFQAVESNYLYQLTVDCGKMSAKVSDDIIVSSISATANTRHDDLAYYDIQGDSIAYRDHIFRASEYGISIKSQSLHLFDLNADGRDEIIFSHNGKTNVITSDGAGNFDSTIPAVGGGALINHRSRKTLAVDFIKADTSTGRGTAYIFSLFFPQDHLGKIKAWKVNINAHSEITGLSETGIDMTFTEGYFNWQYYNGCGLLLGDFDGDGLLLGKPEKYVKRVIVPTIIMNAPPSHYDILEGNTYDVSMLYVDVDHKSDFHSKYMENSEEEQTSTTQLKRDWGVSTEIKAGGKIFKIGVEATLTAAYGEEFSRTEESTASVIMKKEATASKDDRVYGMSTDYYLYEYPVFWKGEQHGSTLVSIPIKKDNTWTFSKDLNFNNYALTHEPGNLLSYPYYENIDQNPYMTGGENCGAIFADKFSLSNEFSGTWTLNMSSIESNKLSKTQKFNIGTEVSASGIGWSANVKGDYSQENMASHATMIKNELQIESNFDKIDKSIGEVEFDLQPYVYWSKNGAMVVDYNVDLTGKWWDDHYGQKPDMAFIMPYRYGPEKGNTFDNKSKRMLTSDIRYFPFDAKPGDTLDVLTTVRNFSLMDYNGDIKIRFYLGDPDNGGTPLTSLGGDYEYILDHLDARKFDTIWFRYASPKTISDKPWIFAVIDPDDEIEEIHTNNNKAFTCLFTDDYPPYISNSIENIPKSSQTNVSIYPNPAINETHIRFYLNKTQPYTLQLFNQVGVRLSSKEIHDPMAGWQNHSINTSELPTGLYFYKLTEGNRVVSGKLMINR